MNCWIIATFNNDLDLIDDEIVYDETAVDHAIENHQRRAEPDEHVLVTHAIIDVSRITGEES